MSKKLNHLTELSLIASLSLLLDKLTLFHLPQGGSVTLSMLAIAFISLRRGWKTGVTCGALVGLLQFLLGAYFLNPIQYLFDYILAFAAMGLIGIGSGPLSQSKSSLVQNLIIIFSCIFGGIARLTCHFIAGITFYASFAPENTPVWIYSLIYNSSFIIPTIVITIIGLILILNLKSKDLIIN